MAKVYSYSCELDSQPTVKTFEFNWEAEDWAAEEIQRRVAFCVQHSASVVDDETYDMFYELEARLVRVEPNGFPDPR